MELFQDKSIKKTFKVMQQKENQSAPYQDRLKLKNPKEFNSDYIITYCIIGLFLLVATNILSPSLDMVMASSLSSIFGLSFSFVAYKQYQTKLQNKLKKLDELIVNYKFNEIENLLENSHISLSHKSQFRIDIKDDNC